MPAHQTPTAQPDTAATATGRVVETMDAGGYTYVQIDTGTEKIWAATSPIAIKVGEELTVPLEMPMQNFHSAKLGRDFPLIYFASSVSRGGEPGGAMPPPAGGQSVAGLWAKRTSLAGKTVVVRGKVVKFLGGIMGKNWVHLQDGTGNAKDGTNDITVTTADQAKPGEILTATGRLAIDRDFGAGYRYGVIVEEATLSK